MDAIAKADSTVIDDPGNTDKNARGLVFPGTHAASSRPRTIRTSPVIGRHETKQLLT